MLTAKSMNRLPLVLLCLALHGTLSAQEPAAREPADGGEDPERAITEKIARDALTHEMGIPLKKGKVHFGDLLGRLADKVGLDGKAIERTLDFELDPEGTFGNVVLRRFQSITRDIVRFDVHVDRLIVTLDRLRMRREERKLRSAFRSLVESYFPDAAKAAKSRYGWRYYVPGRLEPLAEAAIPAGGRVVVLVHGLDEPGLIWKDLCPRLLEKGYSVAQLEYPNDQALRESARFLAAQLAELKRQEISSVRIVAHSMGGLLCREVLTARQFYGGKGRGHAAYPDVECLILAGTPSHGSPLAHLRMAVEPVEQLVRLVSGDGLLFGSIFDGAGEAKLDLLPQSEFLIALNRRPNPEDVRLTTIAGRASPLSDKKIDGLAVKLKKEFGDKVAGTSEALSKALRQLASGVGDGAVSMESSRIRGVDDHVIVNANHISMLMSVIPDSNDVPPAIPVILERLARRAF